MLRNDAVADAGVVGLPDDEAGELPRAYVVLKAGKSLTEADIVKYVEGRSRKYMLCRIKLYQYFIKIQIIIILFEYKNRQHTLVFTFNTFLIACMKIR